MRAIGLPLLVHRLLRTALRVAGAAPGAWRLRHLVSDTHRLRFREPLVLTRLRFGQRIWIDPNDSMARYIFYFGLWEPAVAGHFYENVQPGDVVLDIGANIGQYAVLAGSRQGATGRTLAIEPHPATYEILVRNIKANALSHVTPLRIGAWDRNEALGLASEPEETTGLAHVVKSGGVAIAGRRLDDVLCEQGIGKLDIVKLDVEGAELAALRGLEKSLRAMCPRSIYCEVEAAHGARLGYSSAELLGFLRAFGYQTSAFKRSGELIPFAGEPPVADDISNMVLFRREES